MKKILLVLLIVLCGCDPAQTPEEEYSHAIHPEAKNVVKIKNGNGIEFDLRGKHYYMGSPNNSARYTIEIGRKENDK